MRFLETPTIAESKPKPPVVQEEQQKEKPKHTGLLDTGKSIMGEGISEAKSAKLKGGQVKLQNTLFSNNYMEVPKSL